MSVFAVHEVFSLGLVVSYCWASSYFKIELLVKSWICELTDGVEAGLSVG